MVLAVEELIHLVLFPLDLICDLLALLKDDFLGCLRAQVDLKELLGRRLDAEEICLLQGHALLVQCEGARVVLCHLLSKLNRIV